MSRKKTVSSASRAARAVIGLALAVIMLFGFAPVSRAEAGVIRIGAPEELMELGRRCVLDDNSRSLTVILERDIDLSGVDFSPIPVFCGSFIGGGHTISGLTLDGRYGSLGFIRLVLEDAVIDGLNIEASVTACEEAECAGGIAAENRGVIKNCSFTGTVKAVQSAGGVAGINSVSGIIENCRASGSVEGQHRIGGIAGENSGIVRDSVNRCEVNTSVVEAYKSASLSAGELLERLNELRLSAEELIDVTDIGGVVGSCSGVLRGCINHGAVGHINVGYNVGGIAGHISGYAEDCENTGAVCGRKDVGGIVGQVDPYTEWSFSNEKLDGLRERLDTLRASITALTEDADGEGDALSSDLGRVFTSLGEANSALDILSGEAVSFINSNINTVNAMSSRISNTVSGLAPAAEALTDAIDSFGMAFDSVKQAVADIEEAYEGWSSVAVSLRRELKNINDELQNIKTELDDMIDELRARLEAGGDTEGLIASMLGHISNIRSSLTSIRAALGRMRDIILNAEGGGEAFARALEAIEQAAGEAAEASDCLERAQRIVSDTMDELASLDALAFTPINDDTEARSSLFASVGEAFAAFDRIADGLGESRLAEDAESISESFFELIGYMLDGLEGIGSFSGEAIIEDISQNAEELKKGLVSSCASSGDIRAEFNAGGVVGAVTLDFEFDMEDQFNISALLEGGAKYVVCAAVTGCRSTSFVTAARSYAGGIAGRVDFGVVKLCSSAGQSKAADHVGGIVGGCSGTVKSCMARCGIDGQSYTGGVAGFAHNISGCLALPAFLDEASFCGALAGDSDGVVEDNYYACCDIGGVNGLSFGGESREISAGELISLCGGEEIMSTVKVEFVREGETAAVLKVPFGGGISELPAVEELDGKRWRWEDFDASNITTDLRIEGEYVSPVYVLSTGGERPLYLAEGVFSGSDTLAASAFGYDGASELLRGSKVAAAERLAVPGYEAPLKVHMLAEKDGELFTERGGSLQKTDYERDGSYIVFELDNGAGFVYTAPKANYLPAVIAGGAALIAAGAAAAGIWRLKKKKKEPEGGAEA